jgi:hypothetical protein
MTDTTVTAGQAATDSTGTTVNAPGSDQGNSGSSTQTTGHGPDAGASESFFDPASIQDKPELLTAYKQMQGQFTKAMQGMSSNRQKLDAYDAFMRDPVGTIRQLSTQYGLNIVERGQEVSQEPQEFKTWDDVKKHFFDEFKKEMLNPVVNEVRSLKKQSVEMQLDSKFPDWRTYEGPMMDTLRKHPTLVNDPDTLYRMSVPAEVLEARATKAAMQKLKGTTDNAVVSGGTTVRQTSQAPSGPMTFDQAVEFARKKIAGNGLTRPAG